MCTAEMQNITGCYSTAFLYIVASCKPTSPELSDDKNASAEARSLHSIRSLSVNMLAPEPTNGKKRSGQSPQVGPNPNRKDAGRDISRGRTHIPLLSRSKK